jgi:hypothetical protein
MVPEGNLNRHELWILIAFNIVLAAIFAITLTYVVSQVPVSYAELAKTPSMRHALIRTIVILSLAGALGGILCNLRGIYRNLNENGVLPRKDQVPFYLRPFLGALNGVFVFFLGHLIVSALADPGKFIWMQLKGVLPYIGIALLAGFAVQEFLQKLKEVASTVFSRSRPS